MTRWGTVRAVVTGYLRIPRITFPPAPLWATYIAGNTSVLPSLLTPPVYTTAPEQWGCLMQLMEDAIVSVPSAATV